ncbi:MAG: RNA-binding transcriptional accessory protein [Bacilli bacterium]|nr:RNA-binding transcriptional accessory protein [Bacilli bacterium]
MNIQAIISQEINCPEKDVEAAIALLDEGNTVPFVARYRKEKTGGMTDASLRKLETRLTYLRNVEERQKAVVASISEQGKLTPELEARIYDAFTMSEVEDIYRPYKPKRKTRASIAKEKGLEGLAEAIKNGRNTNVLWKASSFVDPKKGVNGVQEALQGARDIIAEEISDSEVFRAYSKKFIFNNAFIASSEIKKDERDTYANYAAFRAPIKGIPSFRLLALNRGEKEGCLKVALDYDQTPIRDRILRSYKDADQEQIELTVDDALKRLLLPSVENEIRGDAFELAEDKAIEVFKQNTAALLLFPPIKDKRVLGFDPGIRTGCKWALVGTNGVPEKVGVSFITKGNDGAIEREKVALSDLLKRSNVDYIALGNGTGSRESETVLRDVIEKSNVKTKIALVSESGASVYSASEIGEKEFPNLPVEKRSAISLARRLQDPMNELVKIDPKSIGVGQYQHDMNQKKLGDSLHAVVEDCVNSVGVNLNNATPMILTYVSGIGPMLAENICLYLKEHGRFRTRRELLQVNKLGPKAFEQSAGFLRIYGGEEELDSTSIHPESYPVAREVLKQANIRLSDDQKTKEEKLKSLDRSYILNKFPQIGKQTLDDIIAEILAPGRDIRESAELVELDAKAKTIEELKPGMILQGTVRNIMEFGMFVDINVHQDGLVHISEVANKFVKDISDLYSIGDIVKVKVLAVDLKKKRISLSIKQAK